MNDNGETFSGSAAAWLMIIFLIVLVLAVLYQGMQTIGLKLMDVFDFWKGLL
jgi:hypothetical protein